MKILALLSLIFSPIALGNEVIDITQPDFNGRGFGERSYAYQGDEGIAEISAQNFQNRFIKGKHNRHSFSSQETSFWVKVSFFNPLPVDKKIFIHDNLAGHIEAYENQNLVGIIKSNFSIDERVIELTVRKNSTQTYYINNFFRGPQTQSWSYWSEELRLVKWISNEKSNWKVVMAIFSMSFIFNILLLITYRRMTYYFYLLYILGWASFSTLSWQIFNLQTDILAPLSGAIGGIGVAFFSIYFLNINKREYLNLNRLIKLFASLLMIAILMIPVDLQVAAQMVQAAGAAMAFSLLFISAYLYRQTRFLHILIYFYSYGVFLFGACFQVLIWMAVLPQFAGNNYWLNYASCFENVLMLIAMGHKIYSTNRENQINLEEKLHSYQELAKVFYPHQVSQIQMGDPVESTMPVGNHEACVVSFDIINSSGIKHDGFSELVEEFMGKCRGMMMEGYNPETLQSTAYMIKEMGDGFICSIGFPFKQVSKSMAESAVNLAERFEKTFTSLVVKFETEIPVYCSVGVAMGNVKAYFSKSGSIRHDLWGEAIVKAIRYESSRKQIFNTLRLEPSNIIILENSVYESLGQIKKKEFIELDLVKSKISIRDHLAAKKLAFKGVVYGSREIG